MFFIFISNVKETFGIKVEWSLLKLLAQTNDLSGSPFILSFPPTLLGRLVMVFSLFFPRSLS